MDNDNTVRIGRKTPLRVIQLIEEIFSVAKERDEARAEIDLLKRERGDAEMDVERLTKECNSFSEELESIRAEVDKAHALAEQVIVVTKERDEARAEVNRLIKERDDLVSKVGPITLAPPVEEIERLTRERDEATGELAKSLSDGRKQDAKELARLRSIIRQMIRDEAERRIEALGVGRDGGSEHLVYVRPRFGKQRCECRLQAGDSPCPVHVQRKNIDAGEGGQ